MANERMIPALPCASINDTLSFYVALGFEITYQQERPNNYGCVKRDDIDLHFFTLKGYVPAESYSTCLVQVDDATQLYEEFAKSLRAHLGKLPITGIPRITKPRKSYEAKRFNVVDPGGNWIRFIQRENEPDDDDPKEREGDTRLSNSVRGASLLVNAKGDFASAKIILDKGLAQHGASATPMEHVRAYVLLAEIALNLDDQVSAGDFLERINGIQLSEEDREQLANVFEQADELRQMLDG